MKKIDFITAAMLTVAVVLCAGCRVETSEGANGAENVKVETPLGGVQVKANSSTSASDLGLQAYPGAVRLKDGNDDDHDSGSADVRVGFGDYTLGVKVVTYGTNDSADKVLAFYKKSLGNYGDVIECKNHQPVGKPEMTAEGLTCADGSKKNSNDMNFSDGLALKAGSKHHQRIVAVDENGSDGKKTKFVLVELELPNTSDADKDTN